MNHHATFNSVATSSNVESKQKFDELSTKIVNLYGTAMVTVGANDIVSLSKMHAKFVENAAVKKAMKDIEDLHAKI